MGGYVLESTLCGPVGIEIYLCHFFLVTNNLLHMLILYSSLF